MKSLMANVLQLYTNCGNTIKKDPNRQGYIAYTTQFAYQAIAKASKFTWNNGNYGFIDILPITPACRETGGETTHNYNGNGYFIDGDCLFGPDPRWNWGGCWAINPIGELPNRPDVIYKPRPKPIVFTKEELKDAVLCLRPDDFPTELV